MSRINTFLNLADDITKYAKSFGKTSLLQTKPINPQQIKGLRFKPEAHIDTITLSKKTLITKTNDLGKQTIELNGIPTLHPRVLVDVISDCYEKFQMFPSTKYLSKTVLQQIKVLEKQKGGLTQKDLLEYLTLLSNAKIKINKGIGIQSQQELYQKMFTRLKELTEKTPIEDGESISKYFSRISKIREKRIKQLEAGRISFIKSNLKYENVEDIAMPKAMTNEERALAIKKLNEYFFDMDPVPRLKANATEAEIHKAWQEAHSGSFSALGWSNALEEKIMSMGGRYNSSAKQKRIERFETLVENNYKQDFKYEPTYRWLQFEDSKDFVNSLPKRGETYNSPVSQCCSTNKHYAETNFSDECQNLNVKFVLHPKSKVSKAYLLGIDNEVIYPQKQEFRIIDKELIEYINPKTQMGCQRYEIHMQEI